MLADAIREGYKDKITDEREREQRTQAVLNFSVYLAEQLYNNGTIDAELLQTIRDEAERGIV